MIRGKECRELETKTKRIFYFSAIIQQQIIQ
jgi:hypothetical protein